MGFGVKFGVGKKIGPFRAGVSVSHRGLGYGVGAGPFHLTGGTGRSSRSKSSSTNIGISGSDLGVSKSDYFSTGVGCTGFSPNRVQRNSAPSRPWDAAREREYETIRAAESEYFYFLILLLGIFPAILMSETFVYLFLFSGTPFVRSLCLAIGVAVVAVLSYGVVMIGAIYAARLTDYRSDTMGKVNFFIQDDLYRHIWTGELLHRDSTVLTLKKFIYWVSPQRNLFGVFFFQALPLLPLALAVSRIRAFRNLKANALRAKVGLEAQLEDQSELLFSNGFPRVNPDGPRLLNEQEKSLIANSSKESRHYVCVCGYKRAKEHFFVECGACRFAKNQASRK